MKKVLLLLAVVLTLTFTVMAQTQTGEPSGQAAPAKTKKHAAGMAKEATLTGCLSAQPDANGMYTLSNNRHKKGVEVGPADTVKDHAGHQVKLTGKWEAAAAGETTTAAKKEKGKRHFEVANVTHISDTCAEAPGGATTSEKPAGKTAEGKPKGKKGAAQTPPPQQ